MTSINDLWMRSELSKGVSSTEAGTTLFHSMIILKPYAQPVWYMYMGNIWFIYGLHKPYGVWLESLNIRGSGVKLIQIVSISPLKC